MRRFTQTLLAKRLCGIACVSLLLISCQATQSVHPIAQSPSDRVLTDPRQMTFPEQAFHPPASRKVSLANGMTLFLIEDHELPLISMKAMVRAGRIWEPNNQIGLAGLTGTVMRTGGTGRRSGKEIDLWLDQTATELSVNIGLDAGHLSLDLLKQFLDDGLMLLSDVLRQPIFEAEKLEIARSAALEVIRRKNDQPSALVGREWNKRVYGPQNPYGREATEQTLRAISRDDLVKFHQTYFVPQHTLMALSGDFDTEEMIRKITAIFSDWTPHPVTFPSIPPIEERRKQGGIFWAQKDISQTHIRLGHLSLKQDDPDYYALSVLDTILGSGGFSSRLFNDIRTQRGLAYAVGSVLRAGHFEQGVLLSYAETRNQTAFQVVSAIVEHLRKLQNEYVSDEELERAKASFINTFIFSFADVAEIVGRRMALTYYGLPEDFLEQFRDRVAQVTREEIRAVAKRHLHPDRLVMFMAGDLRQIIEPFGVWGTIQEIQLTP